MLLKKRSRNTLFPYLLRLPNSAVFCSIYISSLLSLFFFLSYHLISQFSILTKSTTQREPSPFYLHYVRFSSKPQRNFTFTDYLSVLSGVQYLRPDGILLHGDVIPNDFGKREGKPKKPFSIEHFADVAKLDVLLKYGGVAIDFDVFFLQGERIKDILKRKKAITCYGDEDGNNIGFVAGHKDSKFLWAWRRSYIDIYMASDWNFNQAFVSKYLSVLYPKDVYVADFICPLFNAELTDPQNEEVMYFFRNAMALHTYERSLEKSIESVEDLKTMNNTLRSWLFRNIYHNIQVPPVDPNFNDEVIPDRL
ncbi:hypothetical protein RvY_12077-2 [Ramazzottius varieornatus]|uniref:Alpha-1,4-N-acetylglucosaminyltransferase n=1 Tax=Ramazzottius varieornatus TaxID=947166 RepID=A0A1D1VKA5_RAMVA|nr:hypothetical protein RvY_12077-2 [Ramazzottius varieornatus]